MSVTAIVGINWGDEGKGRMVDYYPNPMRSLSGIRAATMPAIPSSMNLVNLR